MELGRIAVGPFACGAVLGHGVVGRGFGLADLGLPLPIPVGMPVLLLVLGAVLLFAMWLQAWRRNHQHLDQRQVLQFELLARTEELKREQADLAVAREALRQHAIRDELTGLPNRTSILEVLDREMSRAVRDKTTLSVVLADVDYLKKINETHGEPAGDEVLKEVGRRLEHAIRSYDAAGRYHGGEFLLVLPSFEADTGVERLRKIHDAICGKPMVFHSFSLSVTCSFGVSILLPNHFYSAEELLERAAQAMSTAKQDGRNRIGFFARTEG
jgi:diguanylate cyclase (GGDEF)-like protein